jgi:hypothetical protein
MKRIVLAVGLSAVAAALAVGCANGTTEDVDPSESYLANTPEPDAAPSPPSEKVKSPTPDPAPTTSDDAGTSEPVDDPGTPDAGGSTASCSAANTCQGATDLGQVSGDTGADTKNADGSTSKWFTVRVTEDDSSPLATPLWLTATLTSPQGANYDLFLYVPGSDTRECASVAAQSTKTTGTDTAHVEFGETGALANGANDARTVTVEVRHVSGNCDPSEKWTLTVSGNQ